MLRPTTSGVGDKDDATKSMVAGNRMNTGMAFEDILRENQYPKSFARVNLAITSQKKHVIQKK